MMSSVGLDKGVHWWCPLWAWMEELIDDSCDPGWKSSLMTCVSLDGGVHWWYLCGPGWSCSLMTPVGLDGAAHWWCLCGSRRRSSLMMSSVDLHGGVVIPGSDVSHFSSSLQLFAQSLFPLSTSCLLIGYWQNTEMWNILTVFIFSFFQHFVPILTHALT